MGDLHAVVDELGGCCDGLSIVSGQIKPYVIVRLLTMMGSSKCCDIQRVSNDMLVVARSAAGCADEDRSADVLSVDGGRW